jgi:multidrug efflux pump
LNSGRIQINLKPVEQRHLTATEVIARLQKRVDQVPGIHLYLQPIQDLTVDDRVSRTQYQYTLEDPDVAELNLWTAKMVTELRKLPQMADVTTDQQNNGVSVHLDMDRATASRLNITPDQIDSTLYDAFGQRQISTLYTQSNQYHVILETLPEFQKNADKLKAIYIQGASSSGSSGAAQSTSGRTSAASNGTVSTLSPSSSSGVASSTPTSSITNTPGNQTSSTSSTTSPSSTSSNINLASSTPATAISSTQSSSSNQGSGGGSSSSSNSSSSTSNPVPLSAISRFTTTTSPLTINHQGQFPVVTISFNVAPGHSLSQAVEALEKTQDRLKMPASVQGDLQGTAAAYQSIGSNEAWLIFAALLAVYIVLGILYESFIHPVTILSTLPSAGVGALLALRLFHQDLDVIAIIGIILLIGIVKKNGIMIVDFALDAERTQGMNATDAIFQASLLRFRPIMMTTLCALFAGLPLAFGSGIGSELRRPLGIAMVGGLLVSQVLTLYTTPVIYVFFDRIARRFSWRSAAVLNKPRTAEPL